MGWPWGALCSKHKDRRGLGQGRRTPPHPGRGATPSRPGPGSCVCLRVWGPGLASPGQPRPPPVPPRQLPGLPGQRLRLGWGLGPPSALLRPLPGQLPAATAHCRSGGLLCCPSLHPWLGPALGPRLQQPLWFGGADADGAGDRRQAGGLTLGPHWLRHRLSLVESIPQDLPFAAGSPSAQPLAQAWMQLLATARESVHIASYYWSLTGSDIGVNDTSAQPGETLLRTLQQVLDRNVSLAVATSHPTLARNSTDLRTLAARGAQVRQVPLGRLTGGVLHSKFWVVDGLHVYLGSANMDWRSLTQVKELGVVIYNCSRLARDLEKTFQTYWVLGAPKAALPRHWPQNFSSHINRFQPFCARFDGVPTTAYFSASPPDLCPQGRTRDLDALLAVMRGARQFIYVSVMDYFPTTRFTRPARYWPVLDNALREAAFGRGVHVRLLVSCWLNTDPGMFPYLRSLQALSDPAAGISVDVKVFIVPVGNHSNIPFGRVNHSKFMVTEKAAYVGTSNWSEDYFSSTSGVGLVVSQRASATEPGRGTVQEQLRQLFERDWSSRYAVGLDGQAQGQDCAWQA